MKFICTVTTLIILPLLTFADDAKEVNSGLIPYSCAQDGAKYLLAYDPEEDRRAWGSFGGHAKKDETSRQTALREFHEETNCVYDFTLLENLSLKGPSISNGFYVYVVEVPYVDVSLIAESRECIDVERSFWIWTPHDALFKALNSDQPEPYIEIQSNPEIKFYLWSDAVKSMRKAGKDDILNEEDPCKT